MACDNQKRLWFYALAKEGKGFLDKMAADERFSQASRGQVVLEGLSGGSEWEKMPSRR